MRRGKGKTYRHGHSSNPQLSSSHGIGKRIRKESTQQASRIFLDVHSGPTIAPNYTLVPPAYPNVHAFPSGIALSANSSWAAVHGGEMVSMNQLAGYIFMCNGKTKADCYKYRVFGLPSARMDVLEKIKPPMKLFLFDFDLKLLHGIYIAASNGKLAIEPTAFGGKFSAQVRFDIFKDCLPLPESVFKHIIKDNYQGSHKFRQELSGNQVTSLISLFRPIAMPLPAEDERPGFEVPHPLAPRRHSLYLPPPPSGLFYPADAHQSYHPQDPDSRYVARSRHIKPLSAHNVSVQPYVNGPSQFSTPLQGHVPLPPSTRTAAYWAAVASEGLKQEFPSTYQGTPAVSTGLGLPVTSAGAASTPPPSTIYQGRSSVSSGLGMPVTSAGAASTPSPVTVNIDAELLRQLASSVNYNHQNPAVASANPIVREPSANPIVRESSANPIVRESSSNPIAPEPANPVVQEPALVPSQFQAPTYGTNVHLQPSSSSTSGYWTTVASEDPNLAYTVPYQWQWQSANTGVGAENVSAGSAPPYTAVMGRADEFIPHVGTSNDYYAHNAHLATANAPVPAHDQVACYSSAPAYWTGVPSKDPNQLYSGYYQVLPPESSVYGVDQNQLYSGAYQVLPPGSSVCGVDQNQLYSGAYQVLPPGSGGLGGEHLVAASVAGAAATNG